jgi:hypothetical protein
MIVVGEPRGDGAPAAASSQVTAWDRALAAASPHTPPRVRGGGDGGGVIVYT